MHGASEPLLCTKAQAQQFRPRASLCVVRPAFSSRRRRRASASRAPLARPPTCSVGCFFFVRSPSPVGFFLTCVQCRFSAFDLFFSSSSSFSFFLFSPCLRLCHSLCASFLAPQFPSRRLWFPSRVPFCCPKKREPPSRVRKEGHDRKNRVPGDRHATRGKRGSGRGRTCQERFASPVVRATRRLSSTERRNN